MDKKALKYLRPLFQLCIDKVKDHYMVNPLGHRILTAGPFLKAVDPMKYPDYPEIVKEPMEISKIEKKVKSDKYTTGLTGGSFAINAFLADVELVRSNCHKYNNNENGVEIRIMVDAVRNYIRYLIKVGLRIISAVGEEGLKSYIFDTDQMFDLVEEYDEQDVDNFLSVSNLNIAGVFESSGILKLIGIKTNLPEVKEAIIDAAVPKLLNPRKATSKTSTTAAAKKKSSAAVAPVIAAVVADSKLSKKSKAAVPTKEKATKLIKVEENDAFADLDDDEDPFPYNATEVEPKKKPTMSKKRPSSVMLDSAAAVTQPSTSSKKKKTSHSASSQKLDTIASSTSRPSMSILDDLSDHDNDVNNDDNDDGFAGWGLDDDDFLAPPPPPITTSISAPKLSKSSSMTLLPATHVPRAEWEEAADQVLKTLLKHPYVDPARANTCIGNFLTPVVHHAPGIAEEYLRVIENPMDLGTLRYQLDQSAILDAQSFYEMIVSVFQNAVDFNSLNIESEVTKNIVNRFKLLVQYTKWLCLESLPIADDSNSTNPESFGDLRKSVQLQLRKDREAAIEQFHMANLGSRQFTECKKLLKDLERCRNKQEQEELLNFVLPVNQSLVTDYAVYVRNPIDIGTIKFKLDGTLPSSSGAAMLINRLTPQYTRYGEFVDDLRRVFKNAITYNSMYIESDQTEVSKKVYDTAIRLQERLESLLPKFTLALADRVEMVRLELQEQQKLHEKAMERQMKDEEERRRIHMQVIEETKKEDKLFAAEFDIDRKRRETEAQIKAQLQKQARRIPDEDISGDEPLSPYSPTHDPSMSPTHDDNGRQKRPDIPLVAGYGVAGSVPKAFQHLIQAKLQVYKAAWNAWPDDVM